MSADELPAPPSPVRASADSSANEQESRPPIRQPEYGYFDEDRKRAVYGWYDTGEQVETPCESAEQFHAQPFASIPGKPVVPVAAASGDEFRPVRSAPRTSASMITRAGRSELRPANPPTITTKKPESVPTDNPPEAGMADNPPTHPPEAGQMPVIDGVQWEGKKDGAVEAWNSPDGVRNRANKTYLGRFGKRQLEKLRALPQDEFSAAVIAWIAEKRAAKGIG